MLNNLKFVLALSTCLITSSLMASSHSSSGAHAPQQIVYPVSFRGNDVALVPLFTVGDGKCGFRAIGIPPKECNQLIMDNINNPRIRNMVAYEIYDVVKNRSEPGLSDGTKVAIELFMRSVGDAKKNQLEAFINGLGLIEFRPDQQPMQELLRIVDQNVIGQYMRAYVLGKGYMRTSNVVESRVIDAAACLKRINYMLWAQYPNQPLIAVKQAIFNPGSNDFVHIVNIPALSHYERLFNIAVPAEQEAARLYEQANRIADAPFHDILTRDGLADIINSNFAGLEVGIRPQILQDYQVLKAITENTPDYTIALDEAASRIHGGHGAAAASAAAPPIGSSSSSSSSSSSFSAPSSSSMPSSSSSSSSSASVGSSTSAPASEADQIAIAVQESLAEAERLRIQRAQEAKADSLPAGFDPAVYVILNPDLQTYMDKEPAVIRAAGGANQWAIKHYLSYGKNEGRQFKISELSSLPAGFDPAVYVSLNPDLQKYIKDHPAIIAAAGGPNQWAIKHYINSGKNEGRRYL